VNALATVLAIVMLVERAWKHLMVMRFFGRPLPAREADPALVTIVQPILSGDPTLPACLEHNVRFASDYPREYLWLVDEDDTAGLQICRAIVDRYPDVAIQLVAVPRPAAGENPKIAKLIAALPLARGEVFCVLDVDTMLPDGGLERCLPYLREPGVGLVFGLPYYVNYSNLWSSLLSTFVNSHSLMTYVPYTALVEPFTINGMFYALGRSVLDDVGGFAGLQHTLADDFAVAQHVVAHGYRLVQTPVCHAISTQVNGPRHYASIMQRWLIFPRESLLRHLRGRQRAVLLATGVVPTCIPLLLVLAWLRRPSRRSALSVLLPFGYDLAIAAHLNAAFLRGAMPWPALAAVPGMRLLVPLQLVAALAAPQRIVWRGHVMQAERGGTFRYVRRRGDLGLDEENDLPTQA
jgi:ceramide glucosyltransferase